MSKIIVVTSGKGGVGKSTISAFLGAKLAKKGRRTVVCDLDLGLNNLDLIMGCEEKVIYHLSDVLEGRARPMQALVECDVVKNLYLLSSQRTTSNSGINMQRMKDLIEGLSGSFDYVILDCPAGIDAGFYRAVVLSEEALVVTTSTLSALRDADKVLCILRSYVNDKIGIVINMARGDLIVDGESLSVQEVEQLLKTKVVGVIPQDDQILKCKNCCLPPSAPSFVAFSKLAESVHTGKVKLYNPTKKYLGILGSIRRSLKSKL